MRILRTGVFRRTNAGLAIVSLNEVQLRTIRGRHGKILNEYASYIQNLPQGQAGILRPVGNENPTTIRRLLTQAAQALDTKLTIKRSGTDVYFWSEGKGEEQPRSKRKYTRRSRRGRAGDLLVPNQPFSVPEKLNQEEVAESSEFGQTEQVVSDAMRRVDSE
jgi:hypothetical protein